MKTLCFTVDLDRDVNDFKIGSKKAISLNRGKGDTPRFQSSAKGTELLLNLFDEVGIKATFFAEATTLKETKIGKIISKHEVGFHGIDHEDFTAVRTNSPFSYGELRDVVERGVISVRDEVGTSPKGFRSPYMDPNEDMLDFLHEYGFIYDSSKYVYLTNNVQISNCTPFLKEIPAVKSKDANDKQITSYLWPMHEGKRSADDFIEMSNKLTSGTLVLATHSWHVVESRDKGILTNEEIKNNIENVKKILENLLDSGFVFKTCLDAINDPN